MSYGTEGIPELVTSLVQKDLKRLDDMLEELIQENYSLGNPQEGFLFHGEFCSRLSKQQKATATKKLLHPDLHDQGRDYFKERKLVDYEMQRISQGLTIILRDCHNDQDVRDALPDVVSPLIPSRITQLDRTRPEGWPVRDHPLKLHEFEQLVELLSFYVANRLLY